MINKRFLLFFALVLMLSQGSFSGTTDVVLQNDPESGYNGCQDTWMDKGLTDPIGDVPTLYLLYELCTT